jgi:hypothetical protein
MYVVYGINFVDVGEVLTLYESCKHLLPLLYVVSFNSFPREFLMYPTLKINGYIRKS